VGWLPNKNSKMGSDMELVLDPKLYKMCIKLQRIPLRRKTDISPRPVLTTSSWTSSRGSGSHIARICRRCRTLGSNPTLVGVACWDVVRCYWLRRSLFTFYTEVCVYVNVFYVNFVIIIQYTTLVVWLSGNALVLINEVTVRQARLILGWLTVCRQVHHLGM